MTFPVITKGEEYIVPLFNTLKSAEKFSILEGSTVVGPTEFAAPEEINTAIDNALACEETLAAKDEFINSEDAQKIQNYLNQVNTYGALTNYQFEVKYPFSTIILPCPSTLPSGITLYSCGATEEDGKTLTLASVSGNIIQNVPYIIESTVGNKYTIIGWDKGSRATHTNNWLTGVLTEGGANVPDGSYVLAANKTTGQQGFYVTNGTVTCQQASAIIDARKMIVDGAVGMVEMALDRLSENKVVELDDERKAAMVSNLLVVLCGNRDVQPIVNSGSLY